MNFVISGMVTNQRTEVVETIADIYLCPIRHSVLCRFVSGAVLHKTIVFRDYR